MSFTHQSKFTPALLRAQPLHSHAPGTSDPLDHYSFADLGSARLGRGGAAAGGAVAAAEAAPATSGGGGSAASVGAAALSALHARLQVGRMCKSHNVTARGTQRVRIE